MKTRDPRFAGLIASRPFKQVTDRRVRRELRRAAFHAALATRRARSIGVTGAAGDRRVTRGLQRSTLHAVRAVTFSVSPPPSHRVRNTVLIVTGAATTVVAVIAIRKKPWQSSPADAASPVETTEPVVAEAETEAEAETAAASTVSAGPDAAQ